MDLRIKLNRLGKVVNNRYPHINSGGCCVFAALVVQQLRKQHVPAVGIVAAWNAKGSNTSLDEVRSRIKRNSLAEWGNNGINFSHVGVELELDGVKKHYDSNGVHAVRKTLDNFDIYKGRLEYAELVVLAAAEGWNPSFDRNGIPELRKLVKSYISGNGAETHEKRNSFWKWL